MNKRDLRLEKYGISNKRYKELCGFCEQYPEWKEALKNHAFLSGVQYSDMPHSPNVGTSKKTEEDAIKLVIQMSNCELIERVAKEADEEFWQYLIKAVCYEVPLTYLQTVEGMPLEKSVFYDRRRYFFYLLDKAKNSEK